MIEVMSSSATCARYVITARLVSQSVSSIILLLIATSLRLASDLVISYSFGAPQKSRR